MTTIVCDVRAGVMASDSWVTHSSEAGGSRRGIGQKLFRKRITEGRKTFDVIIGTAGESSPALLFVDWYGTGQEPPQMLRELGGDFTCLILTPRGLFEADAYCRPESVLDPYWAIGSGAKAALAAMHCGKSAVEAVRVAARIDPYTGGRIVSMSLDEPVPRKRHRKGK